MKLVAFFVPGDVAAAVAVVNKLNLPYEFTQMLPSTKATDTNPFKAVTGHSVFVRLSDQRVNWLQNHLNDLGL